MTFKIPDTLIVGFQHRSDAMDGKLSFITYPSGKSVYNSNKFNRWIDKSIPVQEIPNTPLSNLVIGDFVSHKVGGQMLNRVRVYTAADLEIEIPVENFLDIIKATSSSKGYINTECVIGWCGDTIHLIDINSTEYKQHLEEKSNQAPKVNDGVLTKEQMKSLNVGDIIQILPKNSKQFPYCFVFIGNYLSVSNGGSFYAPTTNNFNYDAENQTFEYKSPKLKELPVFLQINLFHDCVVIENNPMVNFFSNQNQHKLLYRAADFDKQQKALSEDNKTIEQLLQNSPLYLDIVEKSKKYSENGATIVYQKGFDYHYVKQNPLALTKEGKLLYVYTKGFQKTEVYEVHYVNGNIDVGAKLDVSYKDIEFAHIELAMGNTFLVYLKDCNIHNFTPHEDIYSGLEVL